MVGSPSLAQSQLLWMQTHHAVINGPPSTGNSREPLMVTADGVRFPRMSPSVVVSAQVPNAAAPVYVVSRHQHKPAGIVPRVAQVLVISAGAATLARLDGQTPLLVSSPSVVRPWFASFVLQLVQPCCSPPIRWCTKHWKATRPCAYPRDPPRSQTAGVALTAELLNIASRHAPTKAQAEQQDAS